MIEINSVSGQVVDPAMKVHSALKLAAIHEAQAGTLRSLRGETDD